MSDKEATPPKKGGKGKKMALLAGGALLLGGGGAGAAIYAGGLGGASQPKGPDRPKLVPRDGVSESDAARYYSPTGDKRVDPAKFEATYYTMKDSFTSNLKDGESFVQVGLGVSTYYDERVVEAVQRHEMALRSAVLLTLADQDSLTLSTPQGKEALKDALRKSVNDVLKKKEGFGGIDDVEFTSFVVQ